MEKDILVQNYLEKMNDADLDVLLFPASIVPATKQVISAETHLFIAFAQILYNQNVTVIIQFKKFPIKK